MKIHRIDHVGINVEDLPAAKAFFLELGFVVMGEQVVEGEWVERIELFGEIQNYENTYKLCYIRGPEGIILELAEKLN